MTKSQKVSLFLLRISMGSFFLYAGLSKLLNPQWSAEGYLTQAKTFASFYNWLASPGVLPVTNFLNEWGLTLIGVGLILGVFVRLASFFGILMMALYYIPILNLPYVGDRAFLVDMHIVYIFAFATLASFRAGTAYGLENWCANLPLCKKMPRLRKWLG